MNNFSLGYIQQLYLDFLQNFPPAVQPIISLLLAAAIAYAVIQILRKDWIYIILLVILLPASIPILKNLGATVVQFVRFLIPG